MKRLVITAIGAVVAAAAYGQSGVLYAPGKTIADQGIALKGWGSGTISETGEPLEGSSSISISTRNLFQGGIIQFTRPVSLADQFGNKNNLLRIAYKTAGDVVSPGGGPGGPGFPGGGGAEPGGLAGGGGKGGGVGPGGIGGPGGPGGGGPAGPGGIGGPGSGGPAGPGGIGGPGGRGGFGGATQAARQNELTMIRLIITTTDGKKSEAYVPLTTAGNLERGWKSIAIPLQAIKGFDATNRVIREIAVSADDTTTLSVGDIRVVNDTTPIRGEVNVKSLNLALGDQYTFVAYGQGGSTPLKFTWDFNDKDGVQVDAEGQAVSRKFRKPGKYVVTLTVADMYGLKQPYTTKVDVTVNP